jgi:hypothetical protein
MRNRNPKKNFKRILGTMKKQSFPNIWFADEKRNRSITKMMAFNARGSLEIEPDFLEFKGQKIKFRISNVKQVSITRQQIPWIQYLIMNIIMIVYFVLIAKNLPPVDYLLPFMLSLLLVANAFGLIVGYSTKWVKVEYADDNNETCRVFLADGSSFGWGGVFGGTENLYQSIKLLTKKEKSTTT